MLKTIFVSFSSLAFFSWSKYEKYINMDKTSFDFKENSKGIIWKLIVIKVLNVNKWLICK